MLSLFASQTISFGVSVKHWLPVGVQGAFPESHVHFVGTYWGQVRAAFRALAATKKQAVRTYETVCLAHEPRIVKCTYCI